ncbi:5'-deoxynucleotidase HDDC2 [Tribolium castaneum]|uniref:5'-deoxynucleotidase HDDC2 n=1 Tax=Tribolium castaneum TaxID=7070 RepID=UPI00046C3816|nr:PREDICTED: HD domain-containing protein 2 [Tribolium castaneum]|eukprot:XP_008195856.1 PREDICTED: HD domain-containing protein 2 [Tribolium castaneum]
MEALNPESVLKFMDLVNNLKHSSRRGWSLLNVENHEQIAGHMYAMGMMTFLIGDESNLDRFKCLQLALVHDLAECIVGDITPHDNIPEDKKHALEDKAMKEITSHLGEDIGTMIYKLYKEYEAKETPEAIFVKDLDRLDLLITAVHYEKRDNTPKKMQEFFDSTEGKFKHPFIQKLVKTLIEYRNSPHLNQQTLPNNTIMKE